MRPPPPGVHLMLFAFFDASGGLDRAAMSAQVEAAGAAGAAGIAVLGLATEVGKLCAQEQQQLVRWACADRDALPGARLPVGVTITGASVDEQVRLADFAVAQGADWLLLQPPPERGKPERFYFDFFAAAMARIAAPVGIQNAPEYLGVGLGPDALAELAGRCPNFVVLKGEAPAVAIQASCAAVGRSMPVFNGRGGLELLDNLRAGCAGVIVAAETLDLQVRAVEAFGRGDLQAAEQAYRRALPAIVFSMQSLDTLVVYGKRIAARRLGLADVHDRHCTLAPTPFGERVCERLALELGPLARAPRPADDAWPGRGAPDRV